MGVAMNCLQMYLGIWCCLYSHIIGLNNFFSCFSPFTFKSKSSSSKHMMDGVSFENWLLTVW
jgi:hypothetical protein